MSLIQNVLKIRKAFSEPTIPHNPKHAMHIPDLEAEAGLYKDELQETLSALASEGIVEVENPGCVSVTFVTIPEEFRELMGVRVP